MGYHSEADFQRSERERSWLSQRVVTDEGKVLAQVYGRACPDTWEIIQEQIAERFDCEPDDVQSGEDELGDLVVVHGDVVGRFS